MNLLQPQDRRSARPGDHRSAVDARRRLFTMGVLEPLYAPLRSLAGIESRVFDSGCGEGSFLASLRNERRALMGADLSAHAIDLASRSFPGAEWVVANLDRSVPLVDASVDVVFTIAARRNPAEFRRILSAGGRVVVAVPAPEDLIELRETVGGRADRARPAAIDQEFGAEWRVRDTQRLIHRDCFPPDVLLDLLSASYRGQRHSAHPPLDAVEAMEVTLSFDVFVLEPLE